MSSFFFKQEQQQNLIYDSTAFMHFMIAVCSAAVLVFLGMIGQDILQTVKTKNRYNKIQEYRIFKDKVKMSREYQGEDKKRMNFIVKFIILCVFVAVGYFCMAQIEENQQLSGFDPYQILNIDIGATQSQVKKAYRKLALQTHPDRHVDRIRDPELSRRFILISKAYKCLTDQATRQNCQKYGNPDGETSYKIGIGLPQFMLNGQKQYYLVFSLLFTLIVVVPCTFIRWSSYAKNTDKSGNYMANYQILDAAMSTRLNIVDCCVVIGCMKELDKVFTQKEVLKKEDEKQFRKFILQSSNISDKIINKLNSQQLYRAKTSYQYIHRENNQMKIAYCMPDLCQKMIKFSLFYAKKSLDGSILNKAPKLTVKWLGLTPTKKCINFYRTMINRQRITKHTTIKLQQDPKQKQEQSSHSHSPQQEQRQQQQTEQESILLLKPQEYAFLPKLKLSAQMKLQQKVAKKITTNDICSIDVHVKRLENTPGVVASSQFPFIVQQKFILLISHDFNLLSSSIFKFSEGMNQVHHNFKLNKPPVGDLKIYIRVMSLCYPGIDLYKKLNLQVRKVKERKIQIHQQDKNIQKIPKNFFEYLITMSAQNQSDIELSDDSDSQQVKKLRKLKKAKISKICRKRSKQNKQNISAQEGNIQGRSSQNSDVNQQ